MQLHREHERICGQYNVVLSPPSFEISYSSNWGSWHPATKSIKISRKLITLHSWDVVINVLKHEMAHQVVSELYQSQEKHGKLFDRACKKLEVPLEFRGASGDLPRIIPSLQEKEAAAPQKKMIAKVEKLLSLAQSGSRHEAELAMEKANHLIARYNLERMDSTEERHYDFIIINHHKKRIENYQRKICLILSHHFFVKIVMSDLYDAASCCSHKTIELFGTRENVLIAHYVYHFLLSQLDFLWRQFQLTNKTTGRQKNSYWLGILDGFMKKLSKRYAPPGDKIIQTTSQTESPYALIVQNDKELTRFINRRYPRLCRKKIKSAKVYVKEYEAGKVEGKKLTLNKGICVEEGFNGRLLQ
ncbi:MAG: SprT-like domain-containing protein [Desulfobulbaceae bacterium]|nr:SprT-like domain-containing protein [Desulfobulbaceae bacterium]